MDFLTTVSRNGSSISKEIDTKYNLPSQLNLFCYRNKDFFDIRDEKIKKEEIIDLFEKVFQIILEIMRNI